eukprot:TRINITY_DN41982_c0_g1_i1.p1 TRINITY_DN41982_c0_g1~~TRINITY_DN41982_c0_g1_i1.p1  ORF type:complete len:1223 (-),score=140.03 TRINITY_DN41982_c0_g1_i1:69-3737(-)
MAAFSQSLILPTIPYHGPTARLGRDVVLSCIDETGTLDVYRPQSVSCSKSSTSGPSSISEFRKALFLQDHKVKPRPFDSVLAVVDPCGEITDKSHAARSRSASISGTAVDAFASQSLNSQFEASLNCCSTDVDVGVSGSGILSDRCGSTGGCVGSGGGGNGEGVRGSTGGSAAHRLRTPRNVSSSTSTFAATVSSVSPLRAARRSEFGTVHDESRAACLRACFRHSSDEVEARLVRLEEHACLRDLRNFARSTTGDGGTPATHEAVHVPTDTNRTSALLNRREAVAFKDVDTNRGETSDDLASLRELCAGYQRLHLPLIHTRPLSAAIGVSKEECGVINTIASREEISMAADTLNFHRWLCGLPPVDIESDLVQAAEVLSKMLVARNPFVTKQSSVHSQNMLDFAANFASAVSRPNGHRSVAVLHLEASLIECVQQCINAHHTSVTMRSFQKPVRGRDTLYPDIHLVDAVVKRATAHRKEKGEENKQKSGPGLLDFLFDPRSAQKRRQASVQNRIAEMLEQAHESETGQVKGVQRGVLQADALPPALHALRLLWMLNVDKPCNPENFAASKLLNACNAVKLPVMPPSRPASKGQRIRRVARTEAKSRSLSKDSSMVWGDRDGAVAFRRYLLSPWTNVIGLSRIHDTCVVWSGRDSRRSKEACGTGDSPGGVAESLGGEQATATQNTPEFVSFPPPGIFPHELLHGKLPVWSIMPDSRMFQPTQRVCVRMWRVRINAAEEIAERLEELDLLSCMCDCSPKGNPFCIIFQPALREIMAGDQFEVEVAGLRGICESHRYFTEFRSFRANRIDEHLVTCAEHLRELLDDTSLWGEPKTTFNADSSSNGGRDVSSSATRGGVRVESEEMPGCNQSLPDVGLVSHPVLRFVTDCVDHTISLWCPGAAAMRAQLWLARGSSGEEEVSRTALVMKFRDRFLILLKLPMAPCVFSLTLRVALPQAPDVFLDHPLKYTITTTDTCPSLLTSLEHPLKDKLGYATQLHRVQIYGITLLCPMEHRVHAGHVYFALCFDPSCPRHPKDAQGAAHSPTGTRLFSHRLAQDTAESISPRGGKFSSTARSQKSSSSLDAGDADAGVGSGIKSRQRPARRSVSLLAHTPTADGCAVRAMHECLAGRISAVVQDASDDVHIDISVLSYGSSTQRFVLRLKQRADFSNIYDGLVFVSDSDVGGRVEMFLRFPSDEGAQFEYAPLKLGEWLVCRKDQYPPFF